MVDFLPHLLATANHCLSAGWLASNYECEWLVWNHYMTAEWPQVHTRKSSITYVMYEPLRYHAISNSKSTRVSESTGKITALVKFYFTVLFYRKWLKFNKVQNIILSTDISPPTKSSSSVYWRSRSNDRESPTTFSTGDDDSLSWFWRQTQILHCSINPFTV